MAGRPKGSGEGVRLTDAHRAKIRAVNIVNALQEHVEGTREMTATQVTAGLGLLKKVMPDLAAMQHTGEGGGPLTVQIVRLANNTAS